jgi:hypothetical protein
VKRPTDHPGLSAAATISKKEINQDAIALVGDGESWPSGLVVADGLGSHYRSEIASRAAADAIGATLRTSKAGGLNAMDEAFRAAAASVDDAWQKARSEAPPEVTARAAFGTTAVACLETPDAIVLGFLGNGAIMHLRGNFDGFPASQLLPWNALNVLNPHSIPREGKNLLYKLIGPEIGNVGSRPSTVRIGKDLETFGDIVVVVTDGISSYDQTPMGRDADGKTWVSGEQSLAMLYSHLSTFFAGSITSVDLRETLVRYLHELMSADLVQDDCSVGVLITERALSYQRERRGSSVVASDEPAQAEAAAAS